MIKIGKQDLTDIIDIKNTRLSHTFYQQKFCKKMEFNNFLIEFCFEIMVL